MISLLNTALYERNLKPLGFINPLFYTIAEENPGAFNDVGAFRLCYLPFHLFVHQTVVGDNGCSVYTHNPKLENCCAHGYPAMVGWDAVSGLVCDCSLSQFLSYYQGTPNFATLADEVLKYNR